LQFIEIIAWLEDQGEMEPEKTVLARQFIVDWIKTLAPELFRSGVFKFDSWPEMLEFEKKNNKNSALKD
jgi:hypothetical protein